MVNHFRGRIQYYALWNEQDIGYWNPHGNPEEYGRLLKAFVPAVHQTDPQAKVIYGGQADPSRDFAKRALDTCGCAAGIDIFAYHTYPGYGQNLNPETMDSGAYGSSTARQLREFVRHYPGIRSGHRILGRRIQFHSSVEGLGRFGPVEIHSARIGL